MTDDHEDTPPEKLRPSEMLMRQEPDVKSPPPIIALVGLALVIAAALLTAFCAHAQDVPAAPSRQHVEIGPFPDGRVVWCIGHQDEHGNLVIAAQDAGACRMDTSDVKAPQSLTVPSGPLVCPAEQCGSLPTFTLPTGHQKPHPR